MASSWAQSRVLARIEDVSRRPLDSVALRRDVLEILRTVIDFDAYVWLLTDPLTTVGGAPLADIPRLPLAELPALIKSKYAAATNRWTALLHATSPVALLSNASELDPVGSGRWRELLGRYEMHDVASMVLSDAFGCWGFLDLWRGDHREPFGASDAEILSTLASTMTTGLRDCVARTFREAAAPQRDDVGPVVLILDDELRIRSRTAVSQRWLEILLPPGPGTYAVPASVYNVAAQLLSIEAGVDGHPASTRTHLSDGFWVTLRAARFALDEPTQSPLDADEASIVVTIEESSATERLEIFGRAFALTVRERELVGLLATGANTRAAARRMAVSEHTVQDHLKAIFSKTGARDRVMLLSRALGVRRAS